MKSPGNPSAKPVALSRRERLSDGRAIVEGWGADEDLRALWLEQMDLFTDAAATRIRSDPDALRHLGDVDARAVAAPSCVMPSRSVRMLRDRPRWS